MKFRKLPDNRGMVYVPEDAGTRKKHPCTDCFSCQRCGNERCGACQGKTPEIKKKIKTGPGDPEHG